MKAILFNYFFKPTDELRDFCESIGYKNPDFSNDYDLMFDSRVVEFCEKRASFFWGEKVYKGKEDYNYRVGFAGAGYFRDVDTTKKWKLGRNHVDSLVVDYVDVCVNGYGHISLVSQ